ncbi:MAG: D-alanine--D-alanine ligase [bacterium]|nr:D-alanine--D-alanine ligase [bacterium]
MIHPGKIRVGVLRGGPSSEYDISLKTGATVLTHLPEAYVPVDIFIDRKGLWHVQGIEQKPHKALARIDVAWNALHGEYGEDGEIQRLLESFGVPYSGSGSFASALAMQKPLAKEWLRNEGIKTPYHELLNREQCGSVREAAHRLYRSFPQPSIVKPAMLGSSHAVSLAKTQRELEHALDDAFRAAERVMVEEYIQGREGSCAIIDDFREQAHYALPPVEIRAPAVSPFFDYFAKYSGESTHAVPGNFSREEKQALQDMALRVHRALGLSHYSQSDFIIHPRRGIYFLEVNTLPGLTEHSLLPKALHAVGASLAHFLEHIISLALHRKRT